MLLSNSSKKLLSVDILIGVEVLKKNPRDMRPFLHIL